MLLRSLGAACLLLGIWLTSFSTLAAERLTVWGRGDRHLFRAGSVTILDQEALDSYKYSDMHRLMRMVPGTQIQEEDGFGLRLNIGMRGAHPHRSRKILIMEDGVPAGPAPYAAPASYFVPSLMTLEGLEVIKGPSAILYGPQTIGGAINLRSKSIPDQATLQQIDFARGSFDYQKLVLQTGGRQEKWGWLALLGQFQSSGFKKLPNGGNTGFIKRDVLTKIAYYPDSNHELTLKISWSDEVSNETYLGLSLQDFASDPYQRYAASQLDRMVNDRLAVSLEHRWLFDETSSRLVVYRHDFDRSWNKLNGFSDPEFDLNTILRNPFGRYQHHYDVLRGADDSLGFDDRLVIGNNDRSYFSQGLYWEAQSQLAAGSFGYHELEWGLRLHQDQIIRRHSELDYLMEGGELIVDGPRRATSQNKDTALAYSAHIMDTLLSGSWRFSLGLRYEHVIMQRSDYATASADQEAVTQSEWIPGLGVYHQLSNKLACYGGVYRGLALAGIQDAGRGRPEESINYELGIRWLQGRSLLDVTGFWNVYRNIKGTCSFSSGCDELNLDKTFDGGRALVRGLEWNSSYTLGLGEMQWPLSWQYTFTEAEFASEFVSELADWGLGEIRSGDPLPYIPRHQLLVQLGMRKSRWQANLLWRRQSSSYDQAAALGREILPAVEYLDAALSYFPSPNWEWYVNGDNLLNEKHVVSLRPYGARPGKPQSFILGTRARI